MAYDEKTLLQKCAEGDPAAFRVLFLHWHQLLAGYLYRITESKELSEDLVQEVFMKIWMARESLSEVRNFKGFLWVVSRNHAYDILKKQLKEKLLQQTWLRERDIATGNDPEDPQQHLTSLLDQAIDHLPPRRKEVYLLSRHERLTYQEIAEKLGISRESVKTHLELATKGISNYMQAHLPDGIVLLALFLKIF